MAKVTWIISEDQEITAEVENGTNLMEAAVHNNVPHITGECGGCLSCATCHVYVSEDFIEKVGEKEEIEDEMLEITEVERKPTSRLSCQIIASDDIDGLVLTVPMP